MKQVRPTGFHKRRRNRNWSAYEEDSYRSTTKLPEPTRCPECGAVFEAGRWVWGSAPSSAHEAYCPACRRIHDEYPAGYVTLKGLFFEAHREEILGVAQNCEAREKAEHALQRIMKISDAISGVVITTTDLHLARGIGEAIQHAYQGSLRVRYNKQDNLVRVSWSR